MSSNCGVGGTEGGWRVKVGLWEGQAGDSEGSVEIRREHVF